MNKINPHFLGTIAFFLGLAISGLASGGEKAFINSIGMRFVLIPAGEFWMGGDESPESVASNPSYCDVTGDAIFFRKEHPRHRVTLTKSFYLQVTEVTVDQFSRFVSNSGYRTDAEREGWSAAFDHNLLVLIQKKGVYWKSPGFIQTGNEPVTYVSWNDAIAFVAWLNRKEGGGYRLPTEAEWEYACRAGTDTPFYWGNLPSGRYANFADASYAQVHSREQYVNKNTKDGYVYTAPVGSFLPNSFGLYDMSGNVYEWCQDWSGKYSPTHVIDPQGPPHGKTRVLRGGSWFNPARNMRSVDRNDNTPAFRLFSVGFRVAKTK